MKKKHHIARKIHLWIGFLSGLIATLSGISGSMYVWQPEITAGLNPKILKVGEQTISESDIHSSAYFLFEDYRDSIAYMYLPYREQQSIQVVLKDGTSLYYHPHTKALLGEKTFSIRFFEGVSEFHRHLFIPRYGKYITGGSTVLFFMLVLTSGIYLWWKRYKSKLKKGLSLSQKKFYYDLHKVLGIVFLLPLLTISVTGSYFTFLPAYKKVFKLADVPFKNHEQMKSDELPTLMNPIDLLRNPPEDGYKLRAVYFPQDSTGNFRFRYIGERKLNPGLRKTKEIVIDQNHNVMLFTDYHKSMISDKISNQMYPVHLGEFFGVFGRMLVFITGFIPGILLVTGAFTRIRPFRATSPSSSFNHMAGIIHHPGAKSLHPNPSLKSPLSRQSL